MKTIKQQIEAMSVRWPGFEVKFQDAHNVGWEGIVTPAKRPYLLRVGYDVPKNILENRTLHNSQPGVQVLKPVLERHADYEEGPIPHVYRNKADEKLPYLCLFSPELREWTPDDLLADTTIFWAVEWLYFYEGWLLTRKWYGGGRHVPRPDDGGKQLDRAAV
ncbi:MAG: hypothetical protein HY242_08845 [Afipia sp.]|jgi:hypothetical protein|nr:hypothetical protein [Afipia sp.]